MRHLIIVKFNTSINIQELAREITNLFKKALNINGVHKVEVHVSNTNLQNRHDLMIEMQLTPTALEIFDNSKIHKTWKSKYGKYIENKTVFDCD